MELTAFFKSIVEQDRAPIVICDLEHTIIYMNPSAISNYAKRGGSALIGKSLMDCHNEKSRGLINRTLQWFNESKDNNILYEFSNEKHNKDVYMVALRDDCGNLIGYYEKHEFRSHETAKPFDFAE